MSSILEEGLARYVSFGQLQALRSMRIGMAGLGGIGSNVALMLARTGATSLVLVDHDSVEKSNLNRQCYFPEDVGKAKTEALTERLRSLDENVRPLAVKERITRDNVRSILALADIWVEALDGAEDKAMLVEACLSASLPCIACSGMGGFGGPPLRVRKLGLLTVVGDFASDVDAHPPLAPRVTACAALMADEVLSRIWQGY